MLFRALAAATALLIPSPVAPAIVEQSVVSPEAIVQVICLMPTGISAGTAFRIGPTLMLSVNHVTSAGQCFIDGKPIAVTYKSPDADFSIVAGSPGAFLKVDCRGFVKGRKYLAIGYARGYTHETSVELTATGKSSGDFSVLSGVVTVIPGQSGGPIVDAETGAVVGTVNVYNFEQGWSGSVPLGSTPICGHTA